ncbi:MAG: hypothetical protein JKY67_12450 [Pseudomonadales bacterium]|nr:hypothetical protein [Pseudomonadales bacterium]
MSETTSATTSAPGENSKSKAAIFFLIGLPVITVTLSTLMYLTGMGIPTSTTNKGTLIRPAKQIDTLKLSDVNGATFNYHQSGRWSFILPETRACDEVCDQRLYLTRQVHIAMGKNADALRRIYLNRGPSLSPEFLEYLDKEHPKLRVVNVDESEWLGFSEEFAPGESEENPYYLVDPSGFVMMYYAADNDYKELIKDLKALISRAGGH